MKGIGIKRSKILKVAEKMPPLFHRLPNEEYDVQKSEVISWLIRQPEVMNYVWNNIKSSGAIKYDHSTGKWTGVEYEKK